MLAESISADTTVSLGLIVTTLGLVCGVAIAGISAFFALKGRVEKAEAVADRHTADLASMNDDVKKNTAYRIESAAVARHVHRVDTGVQSVLD